VAFVKFSTVLYLTLGILGLTAAVLVPLVIYRSGTPALAFWPDVASPGQLSTAHAFLGTQCESCHTPNRGIEAASCITCHAPDTATLAKQSTAFHSTIQECRDCHLEHRGADARPITMDHAVLVKIALRSVDAGSIPGEPPTPGAIAIRHFLASITGGEIAVERQVLDCASCHSFRDKHQALFGQECADCHKTNTWKIGGFLHPSPRSQDCNQCHQPPPSHFMMHFGMVDQSIAGQRNASVEQCYLCHQTDSFNDIKGRGWFKMH
jgi:hypothetical protein